ncbi:MAG TPA: DUF1385 domain-containing protein [Candidatus Limnocylindrales bacterium]
MARFSYGGQALIEGVLMRGRDAIAVALRHPDGRIVWASERIDTGVHGSRVARLPFVRGLVVLYETIVIGTRWLVRSASVAASEEGIEIGRGAVALMLAIMLFVGVGIFFVLPLFIASVATGNGLVPAADGGGILGALVEGLIRVALFLVYLLLIAQTPDVRRVFQYHGAEHMTIHALEANDPLTIEHVRRYPTAHPRCGTEFLVVVVILSILVFSVVGHLAGHATLAFTIGSRIILIPVIAAVGYELLKLGARFRSFALVRAVTYPGILVQKITTKQPTDDMIEVAIVSMERALTADRESIPAGSDLFDAEPMLLPGRTAPADPG